MATENQIINLIAQIVFMITILPFWIFFLFHSVQHIEDARERGLWVFVIVLFNIIGIIAYILIKYLAYFREGKRGLIRYDKNGPNQLQWKDFFGRE